MIRTQVYIPEELHQAAKTIAGRGKEPMAEVLRRFIAKGVREEARRLSQKPLANLTQLKITGGPKDLSKNIDKYLYKK